MIKKLRRRFIAIAMCSVAAVLGVILAAINIINYNQIAYDADRVLTMLAENGGDFPRLGELNKIGDTPPPEQENSKSFFKKMPDGMSVETPYESRFFSVTFNASGEITETDTSFVAAIDESDAQNFARSVYKSGRTSGYKADYRYTTKNNENGVMIIFLDCQRNLGTFRTFLWLSIGVAAVGLLAVFVLVVVISKHAMRPVAESYSKQKSFITDASHELKTPLTIIDANTEVLELENGENEWTRSIRNQVSRLSSLTADLVMLSRMEEESPRLRMTDFSLSDALNETIEPFKAPAANIGKRFECDIQNNISYYGDETAIRRVIGILCDNAVKYSNSCAVINISLKKQGQIILRFTNPVEFIKKGNYDVLFERFYRADSSRNSENGGYGIGLSVAKATVLAHKGKISASSPDGKNLVFTLVL